MRNPIDHLTEGLPHGWRVTIDWLVTILGAIAIVLAIKAWVVNPYRIPSSSMEPTLHCARPDTGCEARFSDRVLACRFCYRLWSPKRDDIIVFHTPPLAERAVRRRRHVRQAADRPARRDLGGARRVRLHQRQEARRAVRASRDRRDCADDRADQDPESGHYFMMGDNRELVVRLAGVGDGAAARPDRQGVRDLLAAEPDHDPLAPSPPVRYHCPRPPGPPCYEHHHPGHRAPPAARGPAVQGGRHRARALPRDRGQRASASRCSRGS